MKTLLFSCCIMCSFLLSAVSVSAEDDFTVVAVTEAKRNMSADIFVNADKQDVQKFMPDGSAPASMSSMLLKTDSGDTVLIDAGMGGPNWVKELEQNGVKPEKVKFILLTHFHGDHIGGLLNEEQRRFPNAKILSSNLEYGYWLPKDAPARNPQVAKIRKVYGEDFSQTFTFEDIVLVLGKVEIQAVDAVGHTPGHTVFLITSPKQKLLIIGDLLHGAALQFPKPDVCAVYDVTPEDAVKSRKRVLDFAADGKIPVAGMHLPVPCIGTVKKNGAGGYEFTSK